MGESFSGVSLWGYAVGAIALLLLTFGIALGVRQSRAWMEDFFFDGFPTFDFAVAIITTLATFITLYTAGFIKCVLDYLKTDGTAAYGAMLAAFAALLGFAVAVLAIVCTVIPSTKLNQHMTTDQYRAFLNSFTITIRTLGMCTLLSLLALFLNKAVHARETLFFVLFFAVTMTVPGLIRSALVLEQIVRVLANMPTMKRTHRPSNKPVADG